jgi:ribosomal protein S18 acetylase RimI-like enzyme
VTGRAVAETAMLVVTSAARGQGVGSALQDAVDARLAAAGVHDQVIGAIATNEDAIRLYRRRGFRPAWLRLTRFAAREARG